MSLDSMAQGPKLALPFSSKAVPLVTTLQKQESYSMCWSSILRSVIVGGGGHFDLLSLNPISLKKTQSFKGHRSTVTCIIEDSTSGNILSSSVDGTVRLWDAEKAKQRSIFVTKSMIGITCVTTFRGGREVLAGGRESKVFAWDKESAQETLCIPVESEVVSVCASSLCQDVIFVGCGNGDLFMHDVRLPLEKSRISTLEGHNASISALSFHAGKLYSGSYDTTVRAWDTGKMMTTPSTVVCNIRGLIRNIVIYDNLMAVCAASRSLCVLSMKSGASLARLNHLGWVNAAVFSTDGAKIYSACSNSQTYAWDATVAISECRSEADAYAVL